MKGWILVNLLTFRKILPKVMVNNGFFNNNKELFMTSSMQQCPQKLFSMPAFYCIDYFEPALAKANCLPAFVQAHSHCHSHDGHHHHSH